MAKLVARKITGIIFIVAGFAALVLPVVPGAILIFVGLQVLGFRLAFWDKIKVWLNGNRS